MAQSGGVEEEERDRGGGWSQCFFNASKKKSSAATFQVLLPTSLLDRRGDHSYCINILILIIVHSPPIATLKSPTHCSFNVNK